MRGERGLGECGDAGSSSLSRTDDFLGFLSDLVKSRFIEIFFFGGWWYYFEFKLEGEPGTALGGMSGSWLVQSAGAC